MWPGIAGSVAKTLVAPIDRCKILLQVHNVHYEGFGIFESFYRIVQKEGFLSLYNGNGAQMLRIFPYAAMQFTSYEAYKRMNLSLFGTHATENIINNLVCGSLAGITAVTCTYPLDVIRSRLAFQFKGEYIYHGIVDAVRKIHSVSWISKIGVVVLEKIRENLGQIIQFFLNKKKLCNLSYFLI